MININNFPITSSETRLFQVMFLIRESKQRKERCFKCLKELLRVPIEKVEIGEYRQTAENFKKEIILISDCKMIQKMYLN